MTAPEKRIETWALDHPDYGLIEVRAGYDEDFSALDSAWPGEPRNDESELRRLNASSSLRERATARMKNPPVRIQVLVDGSIQHQFDTLESTRIALYGKGPNEKLSPMIGIGVDRNKPHLKITASPFKELLQIEFREGAQVVEFDPPAGSRGEKRRDAMQSSAAKRTLIPMAEGLGKGGWALLVLVLGPLIGRLVSWLTELLKRLFPDWELPDWSLPEWSLPQVELPVPQLPQVELPVPGIRWPSISIPEMPEWVQFLAEYSKIWVPVVLGVVFGLVALRNHRKSEAQKREWSQR